jgi:hypothetical protein
MKIGLAYIGIAIFAIFLFIPSAYNPLTPKGEVIGIFIEGEHHGYGDSCGEYPGSYIRFKNATWNSEHFHGEDGKVRTYYGNQWKDVDKMKEGVRYRVWYHEESRGSDVTPVHPIYYWVVDGYETL